MMKFNTIVYKTGETLKLSNSKDVTRYSRKRSGGRTVDESSLLGIVMSQLYGAYGTNVTAETGTTRGMVWLGMVGYSMRPSQMCHGSARHNVTI